MLHFCAHAGRDLCCSCNCKDYSRVTVYLVFNWLQLKPNQPSSCEWKQYLLCLSSEILLRMGCKKWFSVEKVLFDCLMQTCCSSPCCHWFAHRLASFSSCLSAPIGLGRVKMDFSFKAGSEALFTTPGHAPSHRVLPPEKQKLYSCCQQNELSGLCNRSGFKIIWSVSRGHFFFLWKFPTVFYAG